MVWFYQFRTEENIWFIIYFQSHYGLILSERLQRAKRSWQSAFNPTMVWFYPGITVYSSPLNTTTFNPTMVWFYLLTWVLLSLQGTVTFNPTMVWFYQNFRRKACFQHALLSIPLWSDFIKVFIIDEKNEIHAFNPTMVWFYRVPEQTLDLFPAQLSIPLWSDFISHLKIW